MIRSAPLAHSRPGQQTARDFYAIAIAIAKADALAPPAPSSVVQPIAPYTFFIRALRAIGVHVWCIPGDRLRTWGVYSRIARVSWTRVGGGLSVQIFGCRVFCRHIDYSLVPEGR